MINDNENIRTTKGSSKMAEGIALQRLAESQLPEDIRIFCDQYATYFINRHVLEWAKEHPIEAKVMAEEYERKMPGWSNSIRARIRYFDDIIQNAATDGFRQLVILGAGYDTRAYRIDSLKNGIKVFEVDNLSTIKRKKEIVKEIFGKFPSHVTFVPFDLEDGNLWEQMKTAGYSPDLKTLFILEGLLMYLSYDAVSNLFSGIARNSCEKSLVLFDFIPKSLADGTSDSEGGDNIRQCTAAAGEPLLSGFADGEVQIFLSELGFSNVKVIHSGLYREMYYNGKNTERLVSSLLFMASASVGNYSEFEKEEACE